MAQSPSSASSTALRLTFLTLLAAAVLVALFVRLWSLQVLAGDRYVELAEQNRSRLVVSEAPRGHIVDRHGEELVKNRPALTVSADRSRLLTSAGEPRSVEAQEVLGHLAHVLDMDEEEIVERLMSRRYSPHRAIPIKEDITPEEVFRIKENQELFPGVIVETLPMRTYPHETLAAHLVGYLGEITEEQLALEDFKDHRPGDLVGKAGLERTYEHELRGEPGITRYEVNANNVVLRELSRQPPEQGHDLVTSLDLDVQRAAEELLRDGMEASRSIRRTDGRYLRSTSGAVVVLDAQTSEVVAMASEPTYDPRVFVGGVRSQDWERLTDPDNDHPLLNRAMRPFPPGSVFKLISGASALEAGLVTPDQTLSCPPEWHIGNHRFRNWHRGHDGQLNAAQALMRSCDTYYYELSYRQWQREERQRQAGEEVDEAMQRMAREFAMGEQTGIDLPAESGGVIPGRAYKQELWERLEDTYCEGPPEGSSAYLRQLYHEQCVDGWRWRGGDAVNMSIGQGDVLTTPLQLAVAYAAIANDGTVHRPRLGREIVDRDGEVVERFEPEVVGEVPLEPHELDAMQRGLEMVVSEPRGTAYRPFVDFPVPSAGKTGTAEFGDRIPFAWYVGYAPVDDPAYVVVAMVEEGGGGSQTAAPIVRRVMEALFGVEVTPFEAGPETN